MGGLAASFICAHQVDIKLLVAYSSIAHMAPVIRARLIHRDLRERGGRLIIIAHGFSSAGLFMGANSIYSRSNTRSLVLNKGLISAFPLFSALWFLLCIRNMGAPPTINLASEVMLIMSFLPHRESAIVITGFICFMAVIYRIVLFSSSQYLSRKKLGSLHLNSLEVVSLLIVAMPPFILIEIINYLQ